jgi:hypothetical protein
LLGQTALGLSLEKACQRMRQNGVQAVWHDDWNLLDLRDCLRAGRLPIVGVERRYCGYSDALHAIVLLEISSHSVTVLDPLGSPQADAFGLATFELAWVSAGQQVLVIQAPFP